MSLSNKELLDKTLFLKDSVLFISIDGKEYEVGNPENVAMNLIGEAVWVDEQPPRANPSDINPNAEAEWPGGVELINHYYDKNKGVCGITMCYSQSEHIKDKCLKWCKTVARLLPKEKKEMDHSMDAVPYMLGGIPDKGAMSYTEGDYKQFEEPEQCGGVRCQVGHTCFEDCSVESSEPQESQELKEAVAGQETLALDLCRCMDLLNRCYWNMMTFVPNDKTMSHAEWIDCLNELELFRTEHPPTKFSDIKNHISAPVESQEELSKFSNSKIGSHHWAATLLSFGMRVGEYMKDHGADQKHDKTYREWGMALQERMKEVNNYLQSLPDKE